MSRPSFIAPTGSSSSTCGYCHSSGETSHSTGFWAYTLTVDDYQALIDRGWRRSGKYVYKPQLCDTCCPAFTIRCRVVEYGAGSKGARKVIGKMRKFLGEGKGKVGGKRTDEEQGTEPMELDNVGEGSEKLEQPGREPPPAPVMTDKESNKSRQQSAQSPANVGNGSAAQSKEVPISQERKAEKRPKPPKQKHAKSQAPQDILSLIRQAEAPTENAKGHRLKVVLERATYQEETFALFSKYQTIIHKDPRSKLSPKKYANFLVESPLIFQPTADGSTPGFGTFHQKYYVDDQLIAVGVLDILPKCVSSVYLMYDPDYAFLSLGTYTALREIALVKLLHPQLPELQFYYMGYYIHTCPKMRYKANYRPSDILCPATYTWVPADKALPLLEQHKVAILAESESSQHTHRPEDLRQFVNNEISNVKEEDVWELMAFNEGSIIPFGETPSYEDLKDDVKDLYAMLGPELISRIILVT